MAGFARVTVVRHRGRRSACDDQRAATLQRATRAFILFALACYAALGSAPASQAQAYVVTLDPAQTKVDFALDTTLHKVHGTFQLKSGQIHFDTVTGKTRGAVIVDARSADSENKSRDKKMHQEILESPKYPEIIFTPARVRGAFDPQKSSQLDVAGTF